VKTFRCLYAVILFNKLLWQRTISGGGGDTARSIGSAASTSSLLQSTNDSSVRHHGTLSGSKKRTVTAGPLSARTLTSANSSRVSRYLEFFFM